MTDCAANVLINGDSIASRVSVGIDPDAGSLYVKVGDRRKLFVKPFTPQMITSWDSARMAAGVGYRISGTYVGFWSLGPIGHPGDGEFDQRSLTSISIHISYSKQEISVKVAGESEAGSSLYKGQPDPENTERLPAWNFELEFFLQRAQLKEFLNIQEGFYNAFERRLDEGKMPSSSPA